MKPTKSILILLSLFLISNCGENLIEEVKERYGGGELKIVEYYKKVGDNQKLVRKREYYENGQIKGEGNTTDGKEDGKWTLYYENGQIWIEGNYKDGEKNGKWTSYNENGQMMLEGNTKDGKSVGKWTTYNEDGSIKKVEEYKDGELVE